MPPTTVHRESDPAKAVLTGLSCWNSPVGNTSARKLHLVVFAPGEVPHVGERKENVRVFCLPASLPSTSSQEWGSQDCPLT